MVTLIASNIRMHDRAGCWQVAIMALSMFQGATYTVAAHGCLRGGGSA